MDYLYPALPTIQVWGYVGLKCLGKRHNLVTLIRLDS